MATSPRTEANAPWLVVVAASAGGIQALRSMLSDLPATLPASIVVVQHRTPTSEGLLAQILSRTARMPVTVAKSGEQVVVGTIYVARPDLHLTVRPGGQFAYVDGTRIRDVGLDQGQARARGRAGSGRGPLTNHVRDGLAMA